MNPDIQRYTQAMPHYQEPLSFLQSILDFQTRLAEKLAESSEETESNIQIEPAAAREKWQAGQPLFIDMPLTLSPSLFRAALTDLRPLLPEGTAQAALDQLLASNFVDSPKIETLLNDLVADSDTCIRQVAAAASADFDTITFLLHTVLLPFFEKRAMLYQGLIDETTPWQRGTCLVCGSEPSLARLTYDNGDRLLACSLCHTEWPFPRLRCPFCKGSDKLRLRHFTVDDDEAHRVDCCDECRRYIKTVDERILGRPANLAVEDVITAHLDAAAEEQGYR